MPPSPRPPASLSSLGAPALLLLLLSLAGCLPHSCSRTESRALLPADSLSRALAAETPEDTLRHVWTAATPEDTPMKHPRTVFFGPDGRLYVGDTERNSVLVFGDDGAFVEEITDEAFEYPYLAGWRADTLLVFNPTARRLAFVSGGALRRTLATPDDLPPRGALQYMAASDSALFFKALGQNFEGYLARLDARGRIAERHALTGPYWRYAGMLRLWGDSLLSLSGFRPVIDVLTPDGRLDTLALTGFDSPMLARSRLFLLGETHEPPLLTSSAAASGASLFVLNMRPGWLRIDVYDHAGRLRRILTQENPSFNQEYYPADLAVRRVGRAFEIAVVAVKPAPSLDRYRWTPTQ